MATSALPTGIARANSAGEHAFMVGFVLGVLEDAPLHPESSFAVTATAIPALLWLELAQVLKDKDGGLMLFGKLNNASTDQMGKVLIGVFDLAPEVHVILLASRQKASLVPVACDAS